MIKGTHSLRLLAVAAVLFATTGSARADLISWGYDWAASPAAVTAGTGSVSLSNETFKTAVGNSQVVVTNLKVFSTAVPGTPDTFGLGDGNYSMILKLTDIDSGLTATLTFTGQLQGSFSASSANVTNTFTGLVSQTAFLGANQYTVTLNAYTPPGPPAQGNLGSIGAFVQVSKIDIQRVPEPTALALAGLGVGMAGLAAWRRRRTG